MTFERSIRVAVILLAAGFLGTALAAEVVTHLFTGWYGIDAGKTIALRFSLYDAKVFGVRGEGLDIVSTYKRK
jgi:hypothetical protein